jgi:hypothetical protein
VLFICNKAEECDELDCPHRHSHDDCGHTCGRVAGARCVMDTAALPRYETTGTMAIFIKRREQA